MYGALNQVHLDPLSTSLSSESSDDVNYTSELPFDLEEQRMQVASERWRTHVRWLDCMHETTRFSYVDRRISLKILISEAFERDLEEARRRGDDVSPAALKVMWRGIAARVMADMEERDNSAVVLRNLSCMGVFIAPDGHGREYGENATARQKRLTNMEATIQRIRSQGSLFDTHAFATEKWK